VELTPFLIASSSLWSGSGLEWLVYGLLSMRFALAEHQHVHTGDHAHGSALAPHAERELFGRLMTALVRASAYVAAGLEGAGVLEGEPPGHLAARGELGTVLSSSLRLFLAIDATFAGERRFGTRGQLGAAWLFWNLARGS
jgi:hypothetical protein